MTHGNQHNHCAHALAACEPCDTAYCTKCNREWRNQHWSVFNRPAPPAWQPFTMGGTNPGDFLGGIANAQLGATLMNHEAH